MTSDQKYSRVELDHVTMKIPLGQTRTRIVDLTHSLKEGMQTYPGDPIYTCRPVATIAADGCSVQQLGLGTHTGTHIDAPSHFLEDGVAVNTIGLESLVARPAVVVDLRDRFQLYPADAGSELDRQRQPSKSKRRRVIEWEEDLQPYEAEIRRHRDAAVGDIGQGCLLLLCTGWDKYWNTPMYVQHPYLSERAANKLLQCGVRVLGVDFLSPDETPSTPTNELGVTDGSIPDSGSERHEPEDGAGAGAAEMHASSSFAVHKIILSAGGLIVENLRRLEALVGKKVQVTIAPMKIAGGDGAPARVWATIMNYL